MAPGTVIKERQPDAVGRGVPALRLPREKAIFADDGTLHVFPPLTVFHHAARLAILDRASVLLLEQDAQFRKSTAPGLTTSDLFELPRVDPFERPEQEELAEFLRYSICDGWLRRSWNLPQFASDRPVMNRAARARHSHDVAFMVARLATAGTPIKIKTRDSRGSLSRRNHLDHHACF